jgi:hypothetical protein
MISNEVLRYWNYFQKEEWLFSLHKVCIKRISTGFHWKFSNKYFSNIFESSKNNFLKKTFISSTFKRHSIFHRQEKYRIIVISQENKHLINREKIFKIQRFFNQSTFHAFGHQNEEKLNLIVFNYNQQTNKETIFLQKWKSIYPFIRILNFSIYF